MNLVGKIFTVLIFLMCLIFGTFALMVHSAHKNWKEEIVKKDGLNDQLNEAKAEKQKAEDEKKILENAAKEEQDRTRRRLTALENERNLAIAERDRDEAKIQAAESDARKLVLVIEGASKNLGVLQTAIDSMRNDIKVTVDERNTLATKLLNTTDDLQNAVNERAKLEKLQRATGRPDQPVEAITRVRQDHAEHPGEDCA